MAGTKYIFDLVENPSECLDGENGRTEETCHVEVLSQPWMDSTEVLWDQTTCTRLEEEEESIPCLGCVDDSEVDQDIVEFVMTELSYGDCQRSNVKVENFQSQVIAVKSLMKSFLYFDQFRLLREKSTSLNWFSLLDNVETMKKADVTSRFSVNLG